MKIPFHGGSTKASKGKRDDARPPAVLLVPGIVLLSIFALLAYISSSFHIDIPLIRQPVLLLVSSLVLAGAVYLLTVYLTPKAGLTKQGLAWIVLIGFILRITMVFSPPMLEDDYFRYLWDGSVTANGFSPYEYPPLEVSAKSGLPEGIAALAAKAQDIVRNINHPELRSIYPPVAQALFAASYLAEPFSLTAWKLILLLFDLATLLLLLHVLRTGSKPPVYVLVYWWNPLLIKEVFNSGHLDALVFPFALGAVILAAGSSYIRSAVALVIGMGIKLWPVILLPVILRPLYSQPKKLLLALASFFIVAACLFLPDYLSGLDGSSGLIAYAERWQNNDSAFRILVAISEHALRLTGYQAFHKYALARVLAASFTLIWIAYVTFKRGGDNDLYYRCLLILAFVFLISPTQFPWYYTWLLPFLAIRPVCALLLPTALLPLYYLRYYLEPRGELPFFGNVVVWIEFVPVWVFLLLGWINNRKMAARA